MILKGLLHSLFDKELCLVTTSNISPDHLYHNGLQRQQFLGAIEQIKRNCDVFNLRTLFTFILFEHLALNLKKTAFAAATLIC